MSGAPLEAVARLLGETFPGREMLVDDAFFSIDAALGEHSAPIRFAWREDDDIDAIRWRLEAIASVLTGLSPEALEHPVEVLHALDHAAFWLASAGVRYRAPRAARSREEAFERLASRREIERWLAADRSAQEAASSALADWIERRSPIRGERATCEMLAGESRFESGAIVVKLRLVCWEAGEITTIKEQRVAIATRSQISPPDRLIAYLDGWAIAFEDLAKRADLEALLPSDLFPRDVLSLKRPKTAEDFASTLRKRLGISDSTGEQ